MLSYPQVRIWLLQTYYKKKSLYNISFTLNIEGTLNLGLFNKCINILILRNDILKTNIKNINGKPQLIFNKKIFKMEISDNQLYIQKFLDIPFDLENDILIKILKVNDKLIFCLSDIIIDGFSINNLFEELSYIYNKLIKKNIPNRKFGNSYYEYLDKISNIENNSIIFWKSILKNDIHYNFPINISDISDIDSIVEKRMKGIFSNKKLDKINTFIKDKNITVFDLFTSVLYILINKYTKSSYICIDTIKGTNDFGNILIGILNNTIILPCNFNSSIRVNDFIEICKNNKIKIFENSSIYLEKLVNNLDLNNLPNIRIHFEYLNSKYNTTIELGNCILKPESYENTNTSIRQLIIFNFAVRKDIIKYNISYKKKCFSDENIIEIDKNFSKILDMILDSNYYIHQILDEIEIKTDYNYFYKQSIDKRLIAYKIAGNYPNINYYNFKNQLDKMKDNSNSTI